MMRQMIPALTLGVYLSSTGTVVRAGCPGTAPARLAVVVAVGLPLHVPGMDCRRSVLPLEKLAAAARPGRVVASVSCPLARKTGDYARRMIIFPVAPGAAGACDGEGARLLLRWVASRRATRSSVR